MQVHIDPSGKVESELGGEKCAVGNGKEKAPKHFKKPLSCCLWYRQVKGSRPQALPMPMKESHNPLAAAYKYVTWGGVATLCVQQKLHHSPGHK